MVSNCNKILKTSTVNQTQNATFTVCTTSGDINCLIIESDFFSWKEWNLDGLHGWKHYSYEFKCKNEIFAKWEGHYNDVGMLFFHWFCSYSNFFFKKKKKKKLVGMHNDSLLSSFAICNTFSTCMDFPYSLMDFRLFIEIVRQNAGSEQTILKFGMACEKSCSESYWELVGWFSKMS